MFRTLDIILVVVMTAAAAVTYTIKHQAELKLEEVRKIEANIKLERDTIDLLRADWALLTQPSRLNRLISTYKDELQLVPTESTQLAQPSELPMLKAELPVYDPADTDKDGTVSAKEAKVHQHKMAQEADQISTGSVKPQ
ncbi:MAG: hypothetical protein KL863_08245 [Rhizobium sp.]|nr:hypothetical protein [Rhizobium sp.]